MNPKRLAPVGSRPNFDRKWSILRPPTSGVIQLISDQIVARNRRRILIRPWLISGPTAADFRPHTGGCDSIDFRPNHGQKPAAILPDRGEFPTTKRSAPAMSSTRTSDDDEDYCTFPSEAAQILGPQTKKTNLISNLT